MTSSLGLGSWLPYHFYILILYQAFALCPNCGTEHIGVNKK
jgi:hypothetical protein